MYAMNFLILLMVCTVNHQRLANGQKEWVPLSSMADHKQQPDVVKMMQQLLAGNDALMRKLQTLEQQQNEQRLQLQVVNQQQQEERQRRMDSGAEQQFLRQLVSNLTSGLTSAGDATTLDHRSDDQLQLRRTRRELQALACNVTAELQTVVSASDVTNRRLQQLETQNGELLRGVQQVNEAVATLSRRLADNLTFAVTNQFHQQQSREQQRHETLVSRIVTEVRHSKNTILTAVNNLIQGGNGSNAVSPVNLCEPATEAISLSTGRRPREMPTQSRRLISVEPRSVLSMLGNCVWAVTQFKNELYVGRTQFSYIEIYDVETLTHRRNLTIPGLGCINDMATCAECDVIYVLDHCKWQMYVIDELGIQSQWAVGGAEEKPVSISVTLNWNVLVTFENSSRLAEYSATGDLVRSITIPSVTGTLTHAVQLAQNQFVVSQGNPGSQGLHRVCTMDDEGRLLRCFGAEKGHGISRLNAPSRLAVVNGTILVADALNDRIIMLNGQTLNYVRDVLHEPTPSEIFVRLSVADDYSRLYVAHNDFAGGKCQTGNVKVYDLTWI